MPPGQVFEDEFCDDARIIQGVSTAGTVVFAMPAKRALEQIPKEQALKEFRYAKELRLFESPTVDLTQTLLILDLLPVVRDFRKPLSAGSVKSTNGADKDVCDTGAAIASGELMRACLAKLTSEQLKKYSEFKNWYPGAAQLIPERMPEPSPGQIEFPRSVRDLMPKEVLILTNGVWRDLKHDSGMTDEELDKIRKHSGLQCPAQLSPPGRSGVVQVQGHIRYRAIAITCNCCGVSALLTVSISVSKVGSAATLPRKCKTSAIAPE